MASSVREPPSSKNGSGAPEGDHTATLHETTNALTVILGWIERAKQAGSRDPSVVTALERASRTAMTTRNALRRAIGASVADEAPERIDSLAKRTVDDLLVEARRADVALRSTIEPACAGWTVRQASAAWQILTNLILNAIAATPGKGLVQLRAVPVDGAQARVQFRVTDEGPGVPPSKRDGIFREGVSGRPGGAGIGLWHARSLARRHGGRLELVEIEQGARFDLDWPCDRDGATAGAEEDADSDTDGATAIAATARGALHGRRVLLLEDDDAVVELLELTLTSKGAHLTAVRDPSDLPAALRDQAIDTMLVDLSPLTGGIDAMIEQARGINPDLVVIVISGRPGERSAATAWVRKPFEPSELVATIAGAHGPRDKDG